ncbi:MAG: hypothetical protein ABIP48_20620 [Planctomycetota bacterium]
MTQISITRSKIAYDSPQVVVRFHDGYTGKLLYAEGISLVDLESP